MKLQRLSTSVLIPAIYNPKIRTGKKELKSLLSSVKEFGIMYPILVDSKKRIIDGHRRLECAKILKLKTVPTFTSDSKLSNDKCYEMVNTTSRKMSPNEMIYVYINGGKVSKVVEKQIKQLKETVGLTELKRLGNSYVSISIFYTGKRIANYCNQSASKEFIKSAILWTIKHKMTYQVRKAMEDGISIVTLKNKIAANQPLKYEWK